MLLEMTRPRYSYSPTSVDKALAGDGDDVAYVYNKYRIVSRTLNTIHYLSISEMRGLWSGFDKIAQSIPVRKKWQPTEYAIALNI